MFFMTLLPKTWSVYLSATIMLAGGLALVFIILGQTSGMMIREGEAARETIRAPKTVNFRSESKTAEAQDQAALLVTPVYQYNDEVSSKQMAQADLVFAETDVIRTKVKDIDERSVQILKVATLLNLSSKEATALATLGNDGYTKVKAETKRVLGVLQKKQIITEQVSLAVSDAKTVVGKGLTKTEISTVLALVRVMLIPNTFVAEQETNTLREEAKEKVNPIFYTVERDQIILAKGQKADKLALEKLDAVGVLNMGFDPKKAVGVGLLLLALAAVSVAFFALNGNKTGKKIAQRLFIYAVIILLCAAGAKLLFPLKPILAYAYPVAGFVLLVEFFVGFELAVLSAALFAIVASLAAGNALEIFLVHFVSSCAAILATRQLDRLQNFWKAGVLIAVGSFVVALAFNLWVGFSGWVGVTSLGVSCVVGGIISVLLVLGAMPLFSQIFSQTTFLSLLDLENPSQPLLKKLTLAAPGTYHHSLSMAVLAEEAAKAIDADYLLTRVGAYYHDIGKIVNPDYFIENQQGKNIHDRIKDPLKSAKMIIGHVEEGVKLAKEYRLPRTIVDLIEQHHGDSTAAYFLKRAEKGKKEEADFRYPGPKPQSKEAVVLMLADCLEAAFRSVQVKSTEQIKEQVEAIVDGKVADGQFREAPITLRDISKLKKVFTGALEQSMHRRIKY